MTYEELGIDPNKLKRDYLKNPLQRNVKIGARICYEYPEYEDLCYLYYEVNLSKVQMCELFNIPDGSLRRCLEHFNINKVTNGHAHKKVKVELPYYDQNKLKRNYQTEPLKFTRVGKQWVRELPDLDDFKYLYIDCNFGPYDLAQFFGTSKGFIHTLTPNFTKTKEAMYKTMQKTLIRKYNADNPMRSIVIKEKVRNTNLKKYGTNWQTQSNNFKEKAAKTNLKRYGVENYTQTKEWKEKAEQTNKLKYGMNWHMQRPEYESIKESTCLKKYGVDNVSKVDVFKEKAKQTMKNKYGDIYVHTQQFKEYMKENKNKIMSKMYTTKKKNNSFNVSKQEDQCYLLLIEKFPNTIRQYKSEKYPFACDFYVPELNIYIEYQGCWTHGGKPFEGTVEDLQKLKLWKNKNTKYYNIAIKTWTVMDPLKRETARKNGLNWIEFFTISDFEEWLK